MSKIQFFTPNGYCWIEPTKVLYARAAAKKVKLTLVDSLDLDLDMSLSECYNLLTTSGFFYLNRAIIVNLHHVFRLNNLKGQRGEVFMSNSLRFEVSRRRKEDLIEAMIKMTKK